GARRRSTLQPSSATPTIGQPRSPRRQSRYRDRNVIFLARSPVIPKITSASALEAPSDRMRSRYSTRFTSRWIARAPRSCFARRGHWPGARLSRIAPTGRPDHGAMMAMPEPQTQSASTVTQLPSWTFEPGHTEAGFRARHMMVTWVHGLFKDVHGKLYLDWDQPLTARFEGEIDATKLWT